MGAWGLSRNGDWHLYARVAPFADCTKFTPPPGTETLCETTPRAARPTADAYLFNWWFSPAESAGMLRYVAPNDLRGMGGGPSYSDYTNSVLFNPVFQGQGLRSVRRY